MRRISSQFIFTSAGPPLKRGIIITADDGTILSVEDTGGSPGESANTEFYNGIIIPGLVNCHSHLELSHMRGKFPAGSGLRSFINQIRQHREADSEVIAAAAEKADGEMLTGGTVACGDISNNAVSFTVKSGSPIRYHTFIEVFGTDPLVADDRISEAVRLSAAAAAAGMSSSLTPHAVYSLSEPLMRLIRQHITPDSVISLHFLESDDERQMADDHLGKGLSLAGICSQLILVHNTVITHDEAHSLAAAGNTWFCLCPSSNMHITGALPPAALLSEVTDRIVTGTDSLASTGHLNILTELRLLHETVPRLPLHEIIRWGTINGARALGMSDTLGSIEPGKKPGLLLVENADLVSQHLLPGSRVRRLL
jgi:cytosine/adenosine deaminase-related metal-dependent hydrolase